MRRTLDVTRILEMGNYFLANSKPEEREARQATANFLESMLHCAGAYAGFQYLASAGLKSDPTYNEAWDRYRSVIEIARANGLTDLYESDSVIKHPEWEDFCEDDTRRHYLTHQGLKPGS